MTPSSSNPPPPPSARPTPLQRNLPNALSSARLVAAGVLIAMLSILDAPSDARLLWAAALFIAAALTDALDGFLARRWNAISRFGRVVDPLADKLLVLGAFVCLAGPAFTRTDPSGVFQVSGVTPAFASIILARELLVTSLRGLVEGAGGDFSASLAGKAKMILQSIAIPLILILIATTNTDPGSTGRTLILACVWLTVGVTALSAWPYITRAATLTGTTS